MSTVNKILVALLTIQVLLIVLVRMGGDHVTISPLEPVLADFDGEAVTRVEIRKPQNQDEPAVVLERRDDSWLASSHFDYPADDAAVKSLLGKVAGMQTRGPTTVNESAHAKLEVAKDNYQRKLTLTGSGAATTLFLGSSPKFKKLSIRVDGEVESYSVANLSIGDVAIDMSSWVDPVYMDIPRATIAALTIETPAATLTVERDDDQRWQLVGDAAPAEPLSLDQAAVDKLVDAVAKIELEEVVGGEATESFGFAAAQARITIGVDVAAAAPSPAPDSDAGAPVAPEREVHIIEIGATTGDRYYLRALGNSHIVTVGKTRLSAVVDATVAKLTEAAVPEPPTPLP